MLAGLIERAYKKEERQVVALLDEYDAPLLDVLHEKEMLAPMRKVMQELYQPLKDCEAMIKFCFITGITKFSQLSIFSTINNLKNVTMLPQYSAICGITEQEVKTVLADGIEKMAEEYDCSAEEISTLNFYVRTQVKCAGGRVDMVVWMPDTIYVFELKVNGTAQEALQLIDNNSYVIPYQTDGRRVVKVGVKFNADTRAPEEWAVAE